MYHFLNDNLVRETGLEPVRHTTHAPQTCLSANSSTRATQRELLYHHRMLLVNPKSVFFKKFVEKFFKLIITQNTVQYADQ